MADAVVEQDLAERPRCWCCGNTFTDAELTRLGSHPEVVVCSGCAHWLWRRARHAQDRDRQGGAPDCERARGVGAFLSRAVGAARARVMRAGAQTWPLVGPLLRRLARRLP